MKIFSNAHSIGRFLRHPASLIFWMVILFNVVKENYPFSHFPMYSAFSNRTHFYYFAQDGEPIPAKKIWKTSIPRSKKLLGGHEKKLRDAAVAGIDNEGRKLIDSPEARAAREVEAGKLLIAQLKKITPDNARWKDVVENPVDLIRVDIRRGPNGFELTERKITSE